VTTNVPSGINFPGTSKVPGNEWFYFSIVMRPVF
jgi:hypothetical protein